MPSPVLQTCLIRLGLDHGVARQRCVLYGVVVTLRPQRSFEMNQRFMTY